MVCAKDLIYVLEDGLSLNRVVELAEEGDCFLCTGLADAFVCVEEEVVACICGRCDGGVEDGEVADAGKDEVLEDGGGSGGIAAGLAVFVLCMRGVS